MTASVDLAKRDFIQRRSNPLSPPRHHHHQLTNSCHKIVPTNQHLPLWPLSLRFTSLQPDMRQGANFFQSLLPAVATLRAFWSAFTRCSTPQPGFWNFTGPWGWPASRQWKAEVPDRYKHTGDRSLFPHRHQLQPSNPCRNFTKARQRNSRQTHPKPTPPKTTHVFHAPLAS